MAEFRHSRVLFIGRTVALLGRYFSEESLMQRFLVITGLLIGAAFSLSIRAQSQSSASAGVAQNGSNEISADYPRNRAGVLIGEKQWAEVGNQVPFKTKVGHGIAAGLSYGLVPAKIVAEYQGERSSTRVAESQPILCICHFSSLPGSPVLVKLHVKKDARELDGGRMIIHPIVGGSKMADANKTDLIAADVSQPEAQVWLVRPQMPLEPGEYALMLGTQNMSIFPFTVEAASPPASQ
jgi:hypothetical protein